MHRHDSPFAGSFPQTQKTMSWFSRKPTQQKYIEAAIKVASNLYLHTIPGAADAPAHLQFNLPDSRFRYMIFCLSAVVAAVLVYDEKKHIQPEALIKGCLHFATSAANEKTLQEYFDDSESSQVSIDSDTAYFQDFLKEWSRWPKLEKEGKDTKMIDLICSMIHTTESNEPAEQIDKQRLGQLAPQIDCRLPTMRRAFVELANR